MKPEMTEDCHALGRSPYDVAMGGAQRLIQLYDFCIDLLSEVVHDIQNAIDSVWAGTAQPAFPSDVRQHMADEFRCYIQTAKYNPLQGDERRTICINNDKEFVRALGSYRSSQKEKLRDVFWEIDSDHARLPTEEQYTYWRQNLCGEELVISNDRCLR